MSILLCGDESQLLYRFAGAKPEILTEQISKLVDVQTVKLRINYRSTQEIVAAQLRLIENNYSGKGGPYPQELVKELRARPDAPQGEPISYQMYDTPQDESSSLVDEIQILLQNGYSPQDIFVASRTRAQLGYLEGDLIKAKIPFINITGGSFWNSKHVQDIIAYVKLVYDNSDDAAFARVYDIGSTQNKYTYNDKRGQFQTGDYAPKRRLGKQFLTECEGKYKNIYRALKSSDGWRWRNGVEDLNSMLLMLDVIIAKDGIALALQTVIDNCYKSYLIAVDEIQLEESSKLDDLQTVVDVARTFEDAKSFFDYVDECIKTAEAAKNGDWSEYVILSTTHKLKGLERKAIFGIGLCEGIDENGEPCGVLPHTYSMRQPPQFGVLPSGGMGRIDDERSICFVLVSRGMERVILSGVRNYQKMANLQPSRFILEMIKNV